MQFAWSDQDRKVIYQRGLAIRAVAAAAFLALFVPIQLSDFGGDTPALPWMNATLAILIVVNPLLWWIGKVRGYPLSDFYVHWALDILAVTIVVYCLGILDVPLSVDA